MKNKTIYIIPILLLSLVVFSCNKKSQETLEETVTEVSVKDEMSVAKLKQELTNAGFQIFDYVDPDSGDTVVMQQYYMAFLKRGPNQSQSAQEADSLQVLHMEHLGRMYSEGYADISGPFADDGDIRGITIYNVPTLKIADSLANMDPMVQSGRLQIEMHPWWAAKGFPLR